MKLEDILNQHQAWLDKAHTSLVSAKVPANGLVSAGLEQQRVEDLKARIAELAAQKDQTIQRTIQRYDTAIADLNHELARLAAEKPQNPGPAQAAAPAAEEPQILPTTQPAAAATKEPSKTRRAAVSAAKAKAKK